MNKKNIILGFVGELASGKDTAVAYLEQKHHAVQCKFSDILRDVLRRLHLDISRGNLQKLSQILRENFSQDVLSKAIAYDVAHSDTPLTLINGIRRHSDIAHLKNLPDFYIIHITADSKIRYKRLVQRGENSDDRDKTFAQFEKDHEAEAEQEIAAIAKTASYTVNNDGTLDELYAQLDDIVAELTSTA